MILTLPASDTPVRLDISASQIVVDCGNNITESFDPAAFGGVFSKESISGKISPNIIDLVTIRCVSNPGPDQTIAVERDDNNPNELAIRFANLGSILQVSTNITVNMWY